MNPIIIRLLIGAAGALGLYLLMKDEKDDNDTSTDKRDSDSAQPHPAAETDHGSGSVNDNAIGAAPSHHGIGNIVPDKQHPTAGDSETQDVNEQTPATDNNVLSDDNGGSVGAEPDGLSKPGSAKADPGPESSDGK